MIFTSCYYVNVLTFKRYNSVFFQNSDRKMVLRFMRSSVALSSVFEPVTDLCQSQARRLCQVFLLFRSWVLVLFVALLQFIPGLFLETVNRFLPVPNCLGQWELPANPVFVNSPQQPASGFLGFNIMGFIPYFLQQVMVLHTKGVIFKKRVKISEVAGVESDDSPGFHNNLRCLYNFTGW